MRERALQLAKGSPPTAANISLVSRETSDEAARWAFTQWGLRERAKAKFALAEWMLFDRDGLEMASHEAVAAYHASQFEPGEPVLDSTVGIGSDAIALAMRGPAYGFDLDAERLSMAGWNLAAHRLDARLDVADALEADWPCDRAWCDPSRRAGGTKIRDFADYSPSPLRIAERMRRLELGGVKLTAMLKDAELEALGGRLEFVSFGGECREAVIWLGRQAEPGRYAVHVETKERLAMEPLVETVGAARALLFEADPAAIRAHCLGSFGLPGLGDSNGYLTADDAVASVWLKGYRVLADHPADIAKTKEALRSLGFGTPVVKARAKGVDVERLRAAWRSSGPEGIVAVYPVGAKIRHAVLQKLG